MTGYHVEVGYNSKDSKEDVWSKLRMVVYAICDKPEAIIAEAFRVERIAIPESYADCYRKPWKDATVVFYESGDKRQVIQLASGYGESRDYKEAMRRAFCRLVLEKMHQEQMEVSIYVA